MCDKIEANSSLSETKRCNRIRFTHYDIIKSRALEPEPELGAGAPEPDFFRGAGAGAGALREIQVELEPELEPVV